MTIQTLIHTLFPQSLGSVAVRRSDDTYCTEGMFYWNLPEIEIVDLPSTTYPQYLDRYIKKLLKDIMSMLKQDEVKLNVTFGIASKNVSLVGAGKTKQSQKTGQSGIRHLRIVDIDENKSEFPAKLIHTYIVSDCMEGNYASGICIVLLRLALEIYSGDVAHPIVTESDSKKSYDQNAAPAFSLLAEAYAAQGMKNEAQEAVQSLVKLAPFHASQIKQKTVEMHEKGEWLPSTPILYEIWKSINI